MAKVYTYIDHTTRPSRYAYVCATSMQEVADIIGLPLSRIKSNLSIVTGAKADEYSHLLLGEIAYSTNHEAPAGMCLLDFERIGAISYLKMAKMTLHQCDLQGDEKNRLHAIVSLIDELRADVSDRLEGKYEGR